MTAHCMSLRRASSAAAVDVLAKLADSADVDDARTAATLLAAHGGGYLASYAPRSDHACFVAPTFCDPKIKLQREPTEYLDQIYFDALVFTPEALRHLVAQVGASQIMLGSDHPYVWEQHPVDHVLATPSLNDSQKIAILGGNAARLFKLKTGSA